MHDLTLPLGLRRRHAWTELVFWGYAAGTDLDSDRGGLDRFYLVYLIVLLGAWAAASAAVLATMVSELFAGLAYADVILVVRVISLAPVVGTAAASLAALRSSPLKLSAPDIAYLAASPIASTALWGLEAAVRTAGVGVFAFAGGYLLGLGLEAAGLGTVPLAAAVMSALMAMVVVLSGWVVGAARLSRPVMPRRGVWVLVWPPIGVWLAAGGLWATVLAGSFAAMWLALTGGDIAGAAIVVVIVLVAEAALLLRFAARADMTRVIDESGTYAELQPLRLLRRFDPGAYRVAARRKRLAARRSRLAVPIGTGVLAPVSRAVQSYVREPSTLLSLLAWGGLVVPAGVLLVLWNASVIAFIPWIAWALTGLSAELTRVFREDVERPSIRRMLPFDTLPLLFLSSLPALLLSTVVSIVVIAAAYGFGPSLTAGVMLAVLLNLLAVLCRGLGTLELPLLHRTISFELGMGVGLVLVAVSALEANPWAPVVTALVVVAAAFGVASAVRE